MKKPPYDLSPFWSVVIMVPTTRTYQDSYCTYNFRDKAKLVAKTVEAKLLGLSILSIRWHEWDYTKNRWNVTYCDKLGNIGGGP